MLTENRKYHFVGELILKRSRVLGVHTQPKDDKVNWLFLNLDGHQYSFVYKIENFLEAKYDKPFTAELAFLMDEVVKKTARLNHTYEILRGQEIIGILRLISMLE